MQHSTAGVVGLCSSLHRLMRLLGPAKINVKEPYFGAASGETKAEAGICCLLQ